MGRVSRGCLSDGCGGWSKTKRVLSSFPTQWQTSGVLPPELMTEVAFECGSSANDRPMVGHRSGFPQSEESPTDASRCQSVVERKQAVVLRPLSVYWSLPLLRTIFLCALFNDVQLAFSFKLLTILFRVFLRKKIYHIPCKQSACKFFC